jgi:hypothetical protein
MFLFKLPDKFSTNINFQESRMNAKFFIKIGPKIYCKTDKCRVFSSFLSFSYVVCVLTCVQTSSWHKYCVVSKRDLLLIFNLYLKKVIYFYKIDDI